MRNGLIGVQMYTLRNESRKMGVYAVLQKIAGLGFHCVEISMIPMSPGNVRDIKRACDDFQIKVAACSAPLEASSPGSESLEKDLDKIVADCQALDCSILRTGMMPVQSMGSQEKALQFAARMEGVAARLAEHGISLYYHNHHIEFEKFGGKYLLDILKDSTRLLGFELDVHWIQRGGEDPLACIRRFAGRIRLLHLKDYRIRFDIDRLNGPEAEPFGKVFNEAIQFAEVGEGNLPVKEIMEAALECGSEFFLIEQDELYGRDAFDCLAISRDNLIKMGYGDWLQPG